MLVVLDDGRELDEDECVLNDGLDSDEEVRVGEVGLCGR